MFLFRAWDSKVSVSVSLLGQPSQLSYMLMLIWADFFASYFYGDCCGKGGLGQALEFEFVEEVLKRQG